MERKSGRRGLSRRAVVVAVALTATSCGLFGTDGESASPTSTPGSVPAEMAAIADGPCPSTLVIQTDWFPQAEHGGTYTLIGDEGEADGDLFRFSGTLAPRYRGPHGIERVEIRAGGFAVGDRTVTEVMAADPNILFGYINTDDIIAANAAGGDLVAVAGTLDISPQMLMWSPARHSISRFEDLAKTGAPVLYFPGSTYMDYLVAEGHVLAEQADDSYDGNPARWLESKGDVIQQGFATNEVYYYQNELADWSRPVDFFLIHWLGYENYPSTLAMHRSRLAESADCLRLLVPIMQRAWVDFFADPAPAIDRIVRANEAYDTFWTVSPELSQAAVRTMRQYRIASNGSDDTYGNFDEARVARTIEIVTDVLERRGQEIVRTPSVDDVVTNEFVDPTVSLPPEDLSG